MASRDRAPARSPDFFSANGFRDELAKFYQSAWDPTLRGGFSRSDSTIELKPLPR
jgi:hypothetical protein